MQASRAIQPHARENDIIDVIRTQLGLEELGLGENSMQHLRLADITIRKGAKAEYLCDQGTLAQIQVWTRIEMSC